MAITDTIADLFTRIRNANHARHKEVDVPSSNLKIEVVKLLKEEGYIKDYEFIKDNKQGIIRIQLKYDSSKKGVISGIRRVSRPGLRKYVKKDKVAKVLNGLGLSILSTSKGILTDRKAREMGVGGEVLGILY